MTAVRNDEADFATWYAAYPRHEGLADARKAWRQTASVRPSLDALLRAVETQRVELGWCRDRRRFIPLPATWLRGERWADEFEVPEAVLPVAEPVRLKPEQLLMKAAKAAFAEVRNANKTNQVPLLWQDPRTLPALQAIGGFSVIQDMGPRNERDVERRFLEAFAAVQLAPQAPGEKNNVVPIRRVA